MNEIPWLNKDDDDDDDDYDDDDDNDDDDDPPAVCRRYPLYIWAKRDKVE